MFNKIKQAMKSGAKKKGAKKLFTTTPSSTPEQDERTSLLINTSTQAASISAAATAATEQLLHHQRQSAKHLTELEATLSIEEMERGAKRLNSDNIDSDSVNCLLEDDDSVDSISSSVHGDYEDEKGLGHNRTLTQDDLDYLVSTKQDQDGVFKPQQLQQRSHSSSTSFSPTNKLQRVSSRRIIDDIGNQLLDAHGDARLEHEILFKSLNLGTSSAADDMAALVLTEGIDEDYEEGGGGEYKQRVFLERRLHESTCKLRAASIDGGGGGGQVPPEIEKEKHRLDEEYSEQRKFMVRQVLTMVAITALLILLVCVALALGTIAVGPPRQPVGSYKIIEAQVGYDFWQYYDFYAGKDSAGSNGYIMYVSEGKAREEGIVNIVTETVSVENMIEIYDDDDPRARENWLEEDLKFLDLLKRTKMDDDSRLAKGQSSAKKQEEEWDKMMEEIEKEKAEKEKEKKQKQSQTKGSTTSQEKKKTKTDNSDSSSTSSSSTGNTIVKGTTKKQADDSVTKDKKASRSLQEKQEQQQQEQLVNNVTLPETTDTTTAKLEPFNPDHATDVPKETFVIISSSPTPEGPRNSIRLEGRRRFNRGLFIIDLRHMPAGCGTWPAFWLTDEANWPVNGEIDIVEGVNYQDTAKTALHTTRECRMDDVPEGTKTGTWDPSVGIPDRKTGKPDFTFRYAQDCFVYDPHQWLNQGCVATDLKMEGRSLGVPLNKNGGGVYALEWDPVYKHIKTWVFSPHGKVPRNLRDALRTATNIDESTRVAPDTTQWGLPYGHFPIGDGTNCPAGHFRNMRLVINLAFCGSVAGNRYFMDCPNQLKKFKTCEKWVASDPDELKEAYWKIRGVYVYEREWQQQWS